MDLLIAPGTVAEGQEDTAPATGTPGFATDGDPTKQTQRTVFPAYAFNDMLKELRAVITNAGLTLDRNDTTQLLQAIKLTVTKVAGDYIGRGISDQDYSPLQGGVNISTGQMWFSYLDDEGKVKYAFSQVAGNYVLGIYNSTTDQRILSIARNKTDSGIYVQLDDNTNQRLQLYGDYATNPALNALSLTVVTKNASQGPGVSSLGIVSKSGQPYCVDTAGVLRYLVKSPGSNATDVPIQSVGINNQRIYVSYDNDTQAAWLVRSPAEGSTDTRVGSVGIAGGVPYFGYGGSNDATNPLFLATQTFARGTFSIGASGYQIFPSGLMLQWDTVTIVASTDPANNSTTVTFPTSFPNGCFGIVGVDFGGDCNPIGANPANNGQAQLRSFKRNTNASASNTTIVHYLAWGY